MDGIKGSFDSFRVEEAYSWRDDIMEITRLIVHETDEARVNNIAEHFEVDLSEIREFLEAKMGKPATNGDRIRQMSDEKLAEWLADILNHCDNKKPEELCRMSCPLYKCCNDQPYDNIEDWLKSPVEVQDGT